MVLSIKEFILRNAVILGALILLVVFLSGTASADIIYLQTGKFWCDPPHPDKQANRTAQ